MRRNTRQPADQSRSRTGPIRQVGERIRELRFARGWTLQDLSKHSRVSQGMLSKLESRSVNPSLSIIERVAAAFEQTVGRFLGEDEEEAKHEVLLLPKGIHRVVTDSATGYTREELSPALHRGGVELIRSVIPPRAGPLLFPPHAPNVEELIFVAQGRLRVTVGGQSYTLETGDSIFLKPSARHSYDALGTEPCVCLIVIDSHLAL